MTQSSSPKKIFDKPFALFMGPQRAGTSWIDRYLRYRKDVCLPAHVKEVFFFDRHYGRGVEFYQDHFKPDKRHVLIAEVSTTSFDHTEAPRRVYEAFGNDIRLICPLRHPVLRSYSLYRHYRRYGIVTGSLQEACEAEPQILNSSRYASHLGRWLEFFEKDNIHFLFQEDLEVSQNSYVGKLCEALAVPYQELTEDLVGKFNAATPPQLSLIAGMAQKSADWFRNHKMYFVLNFARKLGAKELLFGKDKLDVERLVVPEDESRWLNDRLGQEVVELERLIGSVPQWHTKGES